MLFPHHITRSMLLCQVQHADDAISCSVQMIASPAYSSSVICPPYTYTHTPLHPQLWRYPSSWAHSHPQPRNPPLKRKTALHVRRLHCWDGDLRFSLYFLFLPLPVHLLCEGFSNRRVHFIGLERKHHHPSDTLKLHYSTHWVVLTWRWNVCERAAHRFRSKPVLWITKLT